MSENQQEIVAPQNQASANAQPANGLLNDEVNELIAIKKQKAFERGYQQALAEAQQKQMPAAAQPSGLPEDEISKKVADEFQKQQQLFQQQQMMAMQQEHQKRMLDQLIPKVNDAKTRYADFDDVTKNFDFSKIPDVLHYANATDNAGDVLYDLAKNPAKIGNILILGQIDPRLAALEVTKLSNSIRQNQSAVSQPSPSEPLSQVKPSNVGTGDGKPKTAADYRRMYQGT